MIRSFIDFIRWPPPYQGPILSGRIDGIAYLLGWIATLAHISLAVCVLVLGLDRPWPIVSAFTSGLATVFLISIVIAIHRRLGVRKALPHEVIWQWWAGPWDSVGRLVWLPVRLPEAWRAAVHGQTIDHPEVVAAVRAAFDEYESALVANDIAAMNEWFWDDEHVVRFGLAEEQYGYASIVEWRATADPVPADRRVTRVTVHVFDRDLVSVDCEFRNGDDPAVGRQSQTWIRVDAGWRIARAHVSMNLT
jgi:hypothetical protein